VGEKNEFTAISRYISETVQSSAKVTIEHEYKAICPLWNGVISNNLEWPVTRISRYTLTNTEMITPLHCQTTNSLLNLQYNVPLTGSPSAITVPLVLFSMRILLQEIGKN